MRKPADLRKAQIVETVLALADRTGPDRVTTSAVAGAIGITQAALFRHFPSKGALWKAVAETVTARLTTAWEKSLAGQGDLPEERLRALLAAQFDQIERVPALPMLLFSRELNAENQELREAFRGLLLTFQALLTREVGAGQNKGIFRRDADAGDVAAFLTFLVQGIAIRWALGARNFNLRMEGLRLLAVHLHLLKNMEI